MLDRRFLTETIILVIAAVLCAMIANTLAARERKLALVGNYGPPVERTEGTPLANEPQPMLPDGDAVADDPTLTTPEVIDPVEPSTTSVTTTSPAVADRPAPAEAERPTVAPRPAAPAATEESPKPPTRTSILEKFRATPDKPWVEIGSGDAAALYAAGVPFVDARRTDTFAAGHIRGARSMPVWESDIDDRIMALYNEGVDPTKPIVVYCSGGECEDSHMLAQKLWGIGLNNVLVYKDGYPDWIAQGRPTAKGRPQ